MAGLLSNPETTTESTSQSHQTFSNTASEFTQTSTSGQQTQTTTSSSHVHPDGIYRTSSGRETYYPDGHESRVNDNRIGLRCEHNEHQATPAHIISRASYGLFPSQEHSTQQASANGDIKGAGLFSSSNEQEREQEVPLEKVDSSSSSDSSTRYGSNGDPKAKQKESRSSTDEPHGVMLSRRNTRAEIDDEGRRELQRIFTTQSQKMGRQMSIAQPGDPTVDPASDSFDLARFLKMFRRYIPSSTFFTC
jgi:ATP-binding cassette subfamily G (WHITE) protein 2 (PDR)